MASIGIDCRFGSLPVGISTYIRGLVPKLIEELSGHHVVLFVRNTNEQWLEDLPKNITLIRVDVPHYSLLEQLIMPLRIKQAALDVLFVPHFNVPVLSKVKAVVTINDLILHRYPNTSSVGKRIAYRYLMRTAVRRASHIISVSDFTAKELRKVYNETSTVVAEGVDPNFKKTNTDKCKNYLEQRGLTPGYFLYVGNNKPHKNVQALLDAHASLENALPLVLCTTRDVRRQDNVHILSDVDINDMPHLYSGAGCFVTASFYEGFCLPILEARACGCPVIAANTSAIPEVCGSGAKLVSPTAEAFARAMADPPTSSDSPSRYTWESAAKKTAGILLSYG